MNKLHFVILLFTVAITQSSCFRNFYNTKSTPTVTDKEIATLSDPNKTVVVHFNNFITQASLIEIKDSQIVANLSPVPWHQQGNFSPDHKVGVHQFKHRDKEEMESQVDVFIPNLPRPAADKLILPIGGISEIQTYDFNRNRTTLNHVLSTAAIAGGVVASVAALGYVLVSSMVISIFAL
jgi:hypothetical protein